MGEMKFETITPRLQNLCPNLCYPQVRAGHPWCALLPAKVPHGSWLRQQGLASLNRVGWGGAGPLTRRDQLQ